MKEKKNERCLRSCLLLGLAILLVGCGVSTEGTSVLQMPAESGSRTASGENTESEAADADTKMERNPVETTVILTHTMPESSELHRAALYFKDTLEDISGGSMTVDIYADDSLGNIEDVNYFMNDTIDMRFGTGPVQAIPRVAYFPLIQDISIECMWEAMQPGTPIWELTSQQAEDAGALFLGVFPATPRLLTSNQPITSVDDMKELKLRTFSNTIEAQIWQAFGVETTALPIRQVSLALKEGVVDAEENPISVIEAYRFYENQKYVIRTDHRYYMDAVWMSQNFFRSLPEEQQNWILEAVNQMLDQYDVDHSIEYEQQVQTELEEKGVEFLDFPDSEKQKMRELVGPVIEEYFGKEAMDQLWDAFGRVSRSCLLDEIRIKGKVPEGYRRYMREISFPGTFFIGFIGCCGYLCRYVSRY